MEAKAKGVSKSASKAEKKEVAPLKPDPVPAEPTPPAASEPEKPAEDGASDQQEAESGGRCEMLENLKPFLIGGAVIALGAVLVGVILLAKKN